MKRTPMPARKSPMKRSKIKRQPMRVIGETLTSSISRVDYHHELAVGEVPITVEVLNLAVPVFPKLRRITAPTWLRVVRLMPCGYDHSHGIPYERAVRLDVNQSDPHHFPPRGRSGGGSDLETMPLCRPCHDLITDGKLDPTGVIQSLGVAQTQRVILEMLRSGMLPVEFLLVVGQEVAAS